jgi:hypothetical protein
VEPPARAARPRPLEERGRTGLWLRKVRYSSTAADRSSFTRLPLVLVDEPQAAAMTPEGPPPSPIVKGRHVRYLQRDEARAAIDGLPDNWPKDWPRPAVPELDPGAARHLNPIEAVRETQERRRQQTVEVTASGALPRGHHRVHVGKSRRPRR